MIDATITSLHRIAKSLLPLKVRGALRWTWPWVNLGFAIPALLITIVARTAGIRIGFYPYQFGHQAFDIEYYLRSRISLPRWRSVYLASPNINNKYLFENHTRKLFIISLPRWLFRYFQRSEKVERMIFKHGTSIKTRSTFADKLTNTELWGSTSTQLKFDDDEIIRGDAILDRLGVEKGKYVCVHARDGAYGRDAYVDFWNTHGVARSRSEEGAEGIAQEHEALLFQQYRNANIETFGSSLAVLESKGLSGVRIGAKVERDSIGSLPNLIDYAGRLREQLGEDADFADVYLMANCRFFVGTVSGLAAFSIALSRPSIWVNAFPWPWECAPPVEGSLYIPKLLRYRDGRILTFNEMVDISRRHNWREMQKNSFFETRGLEVFDNHSEEIAAVVEEMCDRLDGAWISDPEDEVRQARLAALFDSYMPLYGTLARMGRMFLHRHADLLLPKNE